MASELLDETTVVPYAIAKGIVPDGPYVATFLSGGVSNAVFLIEGQQERVVVKQALSRLRVADEWLADPARAQAEAAAIGVLHDLSPDAVPELLDDDPEHNALTISAAPAHWQNWKEQLLDGVVDPGIANRLGRLLSLWHGATDRAPLPKQLEGPSLFEQLRLSPYFGTAGARRPELRSALDELAVDIRSRRRCLVLGDFSPKNVLVGDGGLWVIDLEVAHRGDPAFDVAFLLSHLAAKALHLPDHVQEICAAADVFITGYGDGPASGDQAHLSRVFAGLLLARVFGSSPLEYLLPAEREVLARRATLLLRSPARTIAESWKGIVGL